MIKEMRIQHRGSGKTLWAKKLAIELDAIYINGQHASRATFRQFYKRPKTFIIDEFFLSNLELLHGVRDFQHKHDFYLVGSVYADWSHYPAWLVEYIQEHFPEQLI